MKRQFMVMDTSTGSEADIEEIALNEPWAKNLIYCDMEGWYLGEDGSLMLADECGQHAFPPEPDRFKIIWIEGWS